MLRTFFLACKYNYTFAINKSGYAASYTNSGGFERPIDIIFGPDNVMYIVDFGVFEEEGGKGNIPETGVIWRVARTT